MLNAPSSLALVTAFLALGARALPKPHPAATYQVVDVGGPTASTSAAAVIYETVAITKSSKPKTVTKASLTVTVTPKASINTTMPYSATASSTSIAKQDSIETPAIYSTSVENSPLSTISLPSSTWAPPKSTSPTSAAASRTTSSTRVAVYGQKTTSTWSTQRAVTTSVASYAPSTATSWTKPASEANSQPTSTWTPIPASTWTPIPASVWLPSPTSVWKPSPTLATNTVFETMYVGPSVYSPPVPVKSSFPTYAVPWNATRHSWEATPYSSHGPTEVGPAGARPTGALKVPHLAM
ncbi:uncharacterized protein RCC_01613 [Ramularia collo-cygni]|uniref:Uncharacterized protein n=1 Tax=Ramularia collo-cygni TaxID=112498 RepID=A0A2D3V2P6_9PEZI|nr:uncharacterized protein RCC_01613 [Ramularia collo-cygni]CZT15779.1 uncharacterized protein RCC_01613 [Ramularia collo-cygni]